MPITRSGVAISLWTGVASEGWVILPLSQCSSMIAQQAHMKA